MMDAYNLMTIKRINADDQIYLWVWYLHSVCIALGLSTLVDSMSIGLDHKHSKMIWQVELESGHSKIETIEASEP